MQLPKQRRNEILKAVEKGGLAPSECTFTYDNVEARITHGLSTFNLTDDDESDRYNATLLIGDSSIWPARGLTWSGVQERVYMWSHEVKVDDETPDLWAELQGQKELLEGATDPALENTPFTSDERDRIANQLNELREYVSRTYSLSGPQLEDLDSKVDYLVDASSRLGRKDWLNACIGAMFSWFLAAALPPDAPRQILHILLSGIANFFGHGFPGLGSG